MKEGIKVEFNKWVIDAEGKPHMQKGYQSRGTILQFIMDIGGSSDGLSSCATAIILEDAGTFAEVSLSQMRVSQV